MGLNRCCAHGLVFPRGKRPKKKEGIQPAYEIEGPWNYKDPVHETITEMALKRAEIIGPNDTFSSPSAWEFVRGVIWSDDPEGLLFDKNDSETDNWSSGAEFGVKFELYKASAKGGAVFANGSPLLARSHFGDLQCLHAMAPRDGEVATQTRTDALAWAEFFYLVSIGRIAPSVPMSAVASVSRWFTGSSTTIKDLFLVGTRGDVRQRAVGALLHLVQDSYAKGHVHRDAQWRIEEFHNFISQDGNKHIAHDKMAEGGIAAMPDAQRAVEACTRILQHWKRARPWSSLRPYLETPVLVLSPAARPSGPGDDYRPDPAPVGLFEAGQEPQPLSCSYNASGTVFDDDTWPDPDESEPYTWGNQFMLLPGGPAVQFTHNKEVDGEVLLKAVLVFNMGSDEKLYASITVELLEGTAGSKTLEDSRSYGPLAVARNTFADVADDKLQTGDGCWASFKLGISNEGD
ncbi:MAG: hypothetical protein AB2A00_04470 [Myxococcota bacterium]